MAASTLLEDLKKLAGKSVIYGLGNVSLKAIGFFLIPLYTRHLTAEDYGIMGVTSTVLVILSILLPLSLHAALMKFYYDVQDPGQRRIVTGNIWIIIIIFSTILTLLLDRFGNYLFSLIFKGVAFSPYIRLVIWIAYLNVYNLIPLNLLQIQEKPIPYVAATATNSLVTILLVIYLVVIKQQGVYGYLLGMLIGSSIMVIPYLIFIIRNISLRIDINLLKKVLLYSLPLVPHGLAGWLLELSDRVILERNVPLGDLGLYNLGYQFGTILILVANAVNLAFAPFIFKTVSEENEKSNSRISPIVTYYFLFLIFGALGMELFIKEVVQIMAAPDFHSVYRVTYWIIAAQFLSASYYIPANLIFVSGKTKYVPLATVISGLINVGLNLWLVPSYGYIASAWATFIAYMVMLLMIWFFNLHCYPFPYQYKRIGITLLIALFLFSISIIIPIQNIFISIIFKSILLLIFPIVIYFSGFFTDKEKLMIKNTVLNKLRFSK